LQVPAMFGGEYKPPPDVFGECGVRGLFQVQDFISKEEEEEIVRELDAAKWEHSDSGNAKAHTQKWGVVTDLRASTFRDPDPSIGEREMPDMFKTLIQRWRTLALKSTKLRALAEHKAIEANAISYHKEQGHYLEPHVDNRQLSGECLCTLSLLGGCVMEFVQDRPGGSRVLSPMSPRSLQVVSGDARWNWTHGIPNSNLEGPRRISVTFRLPFSNRRR